MTEQSIEDIWDYLIVELDIQEDARKMDIVREYGRRCRLLGARQALIKTVTQ
jgi:hypothetical protein